MRNLAKLAAILLIMAIAAIDPRPALAIRGIYCTSYDYVSHGSDMNCFVQCIGCWDLDNNDEQVSEVCVEKSCWFRQV